MVIVCDYLTRKYYLIRVAVRINSNERGALKYWVEDRFRRPLSTRSIRLYAHPEWPARCKGPTQQAHGFFFGAFGRQAAV